MNETFTYKLLSELCYFTGPSFLHGGGTSGSELMVTVPNPVCRLVDKVSGDTLFEICSLFRFLLTCKGF